MKTGPVADGLLSRAEDHSVVTDISATVDFDVGNVDLQIHKVVLNCRRVRGAVRGRAP